MKSILVVNVNWLGDVILSTPVFKNLRRVYPEARICCLAVSRVVPVLEHVPEIDEVITLKEGLGSALGMITKIKKYKFDVAFFLSRSRSRVLLTKLAGIKERVGYRKDGHRRYLTHAMEEADTQSLHRRDIYLNILDSYGIDTPEKTTQLAIPSKTSDHGKDMVLIHMSANWNLKRWPVQNFIKLINRMDQPIGLIGTKEELPLIEEAKQDLSKEVINFVGKTNIEELLQLLENAKVLITADSGPMHVASSLGTPVIALFGPTSDVLTGPCGPGKNIILRYDVGCNRGACYHLRCPENICMQAISVEDVLHAMEQI